MQYAYIVARTIHAPTGRGGWKGPGKEIRVMVSPRPLTAEELDHPHQRYWLKRIGIRVHGCGTYYWNRTGPRSAYGAATRAASRLVAQVAARSFAQWAQGL